MPTGDPPFLVTLVTGTSAIRFMRFAPGQPATTVTIGLEGNWQIGELGVARAHLGLSFDGQQLFIGTLGSGLSASVNGTAIDERRWPLRPPAEVRFGQACLRVAFDTGSVQPSATPVNPNAGTREEGAADPHLMTVLDGVGQWERLHRSEAPQDPNKTRLFDPRAAGQQPCSPAVHLAPGTPPRDAPGSPAAEAAMVPTQRRPVEGNQGGDQVRVASVPGASPPQANQHYAAHPSAPPAKYSASPPTNIAPPVAPPSNSPSAPPANARASDRAPAKAPADPRLAALQGRTAYAPLPKTPVPLHSPPGLPGASAKPKAKSGAAERPADAPNATKALDGVVSAWRSASLVKKVTAVLLPLAFVGVLLPERAPPSKPAPSARGTSLPSKSTVAPMATAAVATPKPTTTASAALAAPAESIVQPSALAQTVSPPAQANSPVAQASSPPQERPTAPRAVDNMERAAIDAAFEGRWQDSVQYYDRLAAAHPDEAVYREAARIVRESKLRQR